MTNELNQSGIGNLAFQDISNSKIEVTNILAKSYEYNDLLDKLKTKQELFDNLSEDKADRRLQLSAEINQLTDIVEQFKRDVLALAETFNKIEINTDRLRRAKEFFDKGEFGEARAVLETELEQMQDEQARWLREKEHFEKDVLPNLINNSEEFYLLAMATQADYTNPNHFEDTCKYFKRSIKSSAGKENVFQYAYFLKAHNEFNKAEKYYLQYLDDFANQLSQAERAVTLNNLANLHQAQNNYDEALKEYEEALQIYRALAETNPNIYLPYVAMTLNNLANLHQAQNNYDEALKEYEEALQIYRALAETNPNTYLPDVSMTLNNLANLHADQNKYDEALKKYEEALQIRRALAETNPNTYLPYVAMTLNNLANLHADQNKYDEALKEYEEALQIIYSFAESNPQVYKIDIAQTNYNLAILYQNKLPNREKSIQCALETIIILLEISDVVIYTQKYLEFAMNILRDWKLSNEEIERLIIEKMKEAGEGKT